MFTGLIECMGTVQTIAPDGFGGAEMTIQESTLAPQLQLGESVAVNGVCLTVVGMDASTFRFQLGPETLLKSNLGTLQPGHRVNLERSLRMGDRIGGHFVQGHVDAMGTILENVQQGEWRMFRFDCSAALTPLMVPKGSIAVDGISLTLVDVAPSSFTVMLIPHTLSMTTLGLKSVGETVNLETDMLARHVAKLVAAPRLAVD
ncbi:riboflavin synthase subunit alpha : Riboflavin synthase, alpha subunit OS=Singulisphaera acidiphila (strain ATCC BAA-1392 / DSM 18658 / VKM B-2454 / MOB10) GN=Sinac_0019 PE=4 SV=1: Lum_binding: Lum_binding [Tuwongella immobilis]|uniref:Riboflavin synthase n=2 Tax=Tuwongella immobilis TaxID=692036 RepID=A0A6C2YPQ6_9BACT|nr:riboflavin synthase subunit alpha : Riboflavin synthase, alpha subunit OS=Singulisphaera acidiphila (strain ATCC BAA-1392 / DSM 18658 / VKM B-2454 / MOB10) GN=Sinac_0019 PE=4 SV=1: Lum_binding: Lum_binding [Tuwongella immobilis]VTS04588.1 riboflavin synthase subunit alpha : Riboflavin synthase, alpha subunit OS=Singulisphaera acidiphila (strain ATCC BAA-1392 / DSM 18658 / VKM B-2454 / MOB10) GN=Sinac_0019 PE=4 SV=1: Lum_binding: Lum_binding [Tuwongella immobilis]